MSKTHITGTHIEGDEVDYLRKKGTMPTNQLVSKNQNCRCFARLEQ